MSGQDYVYIVWTTGWVPENWIVSTFPTKYQAKQFVEAQTERFDSFRIERWRHGDMEGHSVD